MNRLRRDDAGMGLVELLVSMMVGAIVLTAAAVLFTGSFESSRTTTSRVNATAEARLAMDTVARRLRVAATPGAEASAFRVANARQMTFFASLSVVGTNDPLPTLVDYRVQGDCLQETRTPGVETAGVVTWPTSGARTQCLARGAISTDGSALFSYYTSGVAAAPVSSLSLDLTARQSVQSAQVTLAVGDARDTAVRPTRVQTRVTLANLASAVTASEIP